MTVCKACEDDRHDECTIVLKDGKVCACYAESKGIPESAGCELLIEQPKIPFANTGFTFCSSGKYPCDCLLRCRRSAISDTCITKRSNSHRNDISYSRYCISNGS